MTASLIPAIIDALVALADQHLDTTVVDGFHVGEDYPEDELMIGVDDVFGQDGAETARSDQEWAYTGSTERVETGSITCISAVFNGSSDQKAARDRVFEILDAFCAAINLDASLGVPGLQWVRYADDIAFLQDQDRDGAIAVVTFKLSFFGHVV